MRVRGKLAIQYTNRVLTALIFLSIAGSTSAQTYVTTVLVDADASDGECMLHVNRKDPSRLIACVLPATIYRSADGGFTWMEDDIKEEYTPLPIWCDPTITSDTSGRYYFAAQYMFPNAQNDVPGFVFMRSDDYGATWNSLTHLGDVGCLNDKPWMTVDCVPGSPYHGRLYLTWSLHGSNECPSASYSFISHSDDGGLTWSDRDTLDIQPPVYPLPYEWIIGTQPVVFPNGDVAVTWTGGLPHQIHFKKSVDGGSTWPAMPTIIDDNVLPDSSYMSVVDCSIFAISSLNSQACDRSSGPYNGHHYCVWTDMRNGTNNADIFLARSTNGGVTWETQRINDDTTTRNQILPSVSVDETTGVVYIAYMDARTNTDGYDDTLHYYLAYSNDGAETFQTIRVSEKPSTADDWLHSDYMGLDADAGRAHLLWCIKNKDDGKIELWSAIVSEEEINGSKQPPPNENDFVLYPATPNPGIDFTTIDFQLPRSSAVSIFLTDMNGRTTVIQPSRLQYGMGRHQLRIDHHSYKLTQGIYTVTLRSEFGIASRKIEVLK